MQFVPCLGAVLLMGGVAFAVRAATPRSTGGEAPPQRRGARFPEWVAPLQEQAAPQESAEHAAPSVPPSRKPQAPDGRISDSVTVRTGGPIDPYGIFLRHRMRLQDCILRRDKDQAWAELRWLEQNGYQGFVDRRFAFETIHRIDPTDAEANVALGKLPYDGPVERYRGRTLTLEQYLEARDEELGLAARDSGGKAPSGKVVSEDSLPETSGAGKRHRVEELDRARDEVSSPETLRAGIARLEGMRAYSLVEDSDLALRVRALLLPAHRRAALLSYSEARAWAHDHPGDAPGALDRLDAARDEWSDYLEHDAPPKEDRRAVQGIVREILSLKDTITSEWFASGAPQRDTPWLDLLPPEASRVLWKGSRWSTRRIEGDRVVLGTTEDIPALARATVAAGTRKLWRDFDVEADVTLIHEGVALLARFHPAAPPTRVDLPVRKADAAAGTGGIVEGKTYRLRLEVRGGRIRLLLDGAVVEESLVPPASRHGGGLGFELRPGARIEICGLRVRVYR